MKWLGAILLIIIFTMIGFEFSSRLNKRPKHIRQIKSALFILEAEILYSHSKLQDSFKMISKQIDNPTKQLFLNVYKNLASFNGDLSNLWKKCVSNYVKEAYLSNVEKEILIQFGKTLGQYDVVQQQKYIKVTIEHLDRTLEEAEKKKNEYGNMAKTLGILFGIFIVILLL